MRMDLLNRKLKTTQEKISYSESIMANPKDFTVRRVERAKDRILKYSKLQKQVIADIQKMKDSKKRPSLNDKLIESIQAIVCKYFGVEMSGITKTDRANSQVAEARMVVSYFVVLYSKGVQQRVIAERFNFPLNRVNYALRALSEKIQLNKSFRLTMGLVNLKIAETANIEPKKLLVGKTKPIAEEGTSIVRPSKEMPTILNEWLKPLRKNNLKNSQVVKPVYF